MGRQNYSVKVLQYAFAIISVVTSTYLCDLVALRRYCSFFEEGKLTIYIRASSKELIANVYGVVAFVRDCFANLSADISHYLLMHLL